MSGKSYVVTAPYITMKGRDQSGGMVNRGLYAGAVVNGDDVDAASLQHHLDGDMIAEVGSPQAAAVEISVPPVTDPVPLAADQVEDSKPAPKAKPAAK